MCTPHYILNVQKFYHRLKVVKQACNFWQVVYFLSYVWVKRCLFPVDWENPVSRQVVKIICKGLQLTLSLNLSIRIIILSWPWALFGSNFRINFKISFSENLTVLKHVFVCGKSWGGIWLSFFKREHCLAKWESKIWLFIWKSVTNLSSWSMGVYKEFFYRWKNVLELSNNIFH